MDRQYREDSARLAELVEKYDHVVVGGDMATSLLGEGHISIPTKTGQPRIKEQMESVSARYKHVPDKNIPRKKPHAHDERA